jgi:DNA-binding PadR family transcriptional regulator
MASSRTVLGVLGRGPAHGYDIKRTHDATLPVAKPLAFGQVYATLARLMRDGLVEVVEVSRGGGPERNVYALTEVGGQKLRDWLAAPVPPAPYVGSEVVEKTLLALHLGAGARSYLRRQRSAHLARMRELVAAKPASMEERLAVDFAIAHLDADLRWIEDTTARLAEQP